MPKPLNEGVRPVAKQVQGRDRVEGVMKLIDAAQGKDNNFNLIRLIAALAVLVTHSFAIATGDPKIEPLRGWLGMTLGDFAVDAFFITSGFLVTASLARRQSGLEFVCARALRIYPALLVMLGLTVFVVGPALSRLPLADYFSQWVTFKYLAKCATLVFGIEYFLPGLFEANPYKAAVNGSLWSMPWELRMYILLLVMWVVAKRAETDRPRFWNRAIVLVFVLSAIAHLTTHFLVSETVHELRLMFMFFTGAAFYVLRRHIVLSPVLAGAAIIALGLGLLHREAFFLAYIVTIAYLLLWIAYIPSGCIRRFNRLGDYSYGTYIYAFPVQQVTATLLPGVSVLTMVFASGAITLALAVASWHLIERRALNLKERVGQAARRWVFPRTATG